MGLKIPFMDDDSDFRGEFQQKENLGFGCRRDAEPAGKRFHLSSPIIY